MRVGVDCIPSLAGVDLGGFSGENLKITRAETYGSHVAFFIMILICIVLKLFTYLGPMLLCLVEILILQMWILCNPVRWQFRALMLTGHVRCGGECYFCH